VNKKILATVAVVVVLVFSSLIYFVSIENNQSIPIDTNAKSTPYDYTEGVNIVPGEYLEPVFNDITGDFRPMYEGMSHEQYGYFFSELPEFEQDFFTISKLVYDGKITDYSRLSENYWKQPEFYPGWFSSVDNAYIYNNPYRWKPEGYGCYPAIKEISVRKGTNIVVNTYLRTAFATEAFQGLVIKPELPDCAYSMRSNVIFEQPENVESYLQINIGNEDNALYNSFKDTLFTTNVEDIDWFVILKPTYELLKDKYNNVIGEQGFPTDWVRIVELEIDISSSTPSGDYVVSLDIVPPCFEINQEFYFSSEHEYYGTMYHPSGHFHRTIKPHFQVIVHVV